MTPVLILRPQPGGDATARRAEAQGFPTVVAPLFTIEAEQWSAPDPAEFDALFVTSANAVRAAGPQLEQYRKVPLYAVGCATATAARQAGFTDIVEGISDGSDLLQQAMADGMQRLLHLTGRDHMAIGDPRAEIKRHIVYRAEPVGRLPERALAALGAGAITLLHSPRAARIFAQLLGDAGSRRETIRLAAFSLAVARAAGDGWRQVAIAAQPTDQALLAAAARLCDQDTTAPLAGRDGDRA